MSNKLEHGHRMNSDPCPFSSDFGLEDGHVPTLWSLLYVLDPLGPKRILGSRSRDEDVEQQINWNVLLLRPALELSCIDPNTM